MLYGDEFFFFTDSVHRFQNEEDASKELDFKTQTEDGEIRNPTIKEEFVKVIK